LIIGKSKEFRATVTSTAQVRILSVFVRGRALLCFAAMGFHFEHQDLEGILRKLDEIDWRQGERIVDIIEEIIAEAYEAFAKGRRLPADWSLRIITRLQAIEAEDQTSSN
jgi:hypothetical protein